MLLFIFFIVLVVIAVGLFLTSPLVPAKTSYSSAPARRIQRLAALGVAALSLILLFFASISTVGTKNVGVLTTFGRPSGYIQNGFHFKAPWQSVTELNDAIQTDTYATDANDGKQQQGAVGSCVNVRVARQATACVNVSIRWQIKPSGVDYLFRNYKGNEAITDNLVLRDLQSAMNENLRDYDPLGIDANGNNTNEALNAPNGARSISADVTAEMQSQIGRWVDVKSVFIPILNFDGKTQDKIGQLQQQIVQTRVANQQVLTNQAQAEANRAISQSVTSTPGVLQDKCLNILKEAVDKGASIQGAPSCFGGSPNAIVSTK